MKRLLFAILLALASSTAGERAAAQALPAAAVTPGPVTVAGALTPPAFPDAPQEVIGWAAGELHAWPKVVGALASLMLILRGIAEFMTRVSTVLTGLSTVIPNPYLQQAAMITAWIAAIIGWMISIFSAGSPKSIPIPALAPRPPCPPSGCPPKA